MVRQSQSKLAQLRGLNGMHRGFAEVCFFFMLAALLLEVPKSVLGALCFAGGQFACTIWPTGKTREQNTPFLDFSF